MPVLQGNRGPRRVLLVTATAAVLAAGGAGMAYATAHGPVVESGYAVETADLSTEQSDTTKLTQTDEECERARQKQGEQPTPGGSEQPTPGGSQQPTPSGSEQPTPDESAPADVTGRL